MRILIIYKQTFDQLNLSSVKRYISNDNITPASLMDLILNRFVCKIETFPSLKYSNNE